jgi:hypothetical protein
MRAAILTLWLLALACASVPRAPIPADLVLDDVTLLDPASNTVTRNRAIAIRDGVIVGVYPAGVNATRRVSLGGRWVVPGLWDAHVHVLSTTRYQDLQPTLRRMIGYGIVAARDMGSLPDTARLIVPVAAGDTVAPFLTWVGPLLDGPRFQWSQRVAWHLTTEDGATRAVDSLAALGVSHLKIYGSLGRREFEVVARRARAHGLSFGGHVPNGVSPTAAAAAGMRTIEHIGLDLVAGCTSDGRARVGRVLSRWGAEGYGARFEEMQALWAARDINACEQQARALAAAGTFVTPTLGLELKGRAQTESAAYAALDSLGRVYCRGTVDAILSAAAPVRERVYQSLRDDVALLHRSGVRLLAGTDLGNPCLAPGVSLHNELELLHAAGVPAIDVLRSATVHPAVAQDLRDWGRIEAGFKASLVVTATDPRISLAALRTPAAVFHRGVFLDSVSLARLREQR